jgi:hypothetical protein
MADYKTAEQYVVEKVEELERDLKAKKIEHKLEMANVQKALEKTREELCEAYDLLNIFRDYIYANKDNYFGNCVRMEIIYGKEHPEEVARIMEYYDMRPEEDKEDA